MPLSFVARQQKSLAAIPAFASTLLVQFERLILPRLRIRLIGFEVCGEMEEKRLFGNVLEGEEERNEGWSDLFSELLLLEDNPKSVKSMILIVENCVNYIPA